MSTDEYSFIYNRLDFHNSSISEIDFKEIRKNYFIKKYSRDSINTLDNPSNA